MEWLGKIMPGRWTLLYRILMAGFVLAAVLNLFHLNAGFFTNYLADLTLPALLYVLSRGLVPNRRLVGPLNRWLGRTPEIALAFFFWASTATELSQLYWPRGFFAGRFDPWDILAYGVGLLACYSLEKLNSQKS
jgi:hypothetical protein